MHLCGVLAAVVGAWGCGGMAMQQGTMTADNAEDSEEVNAPLAVGGTIQPSINMDLRGTAAPTLVLVSARPSVASADQGRIVGHEPGVTAILVTTKEGTVLDFYHLWVEAASRATLHRIEGDGEDLGEVMEGIDMLVGESVYLKPRVYYQAQELAGVVPGKWTVEPPIATVLREGMPERRRIVARRPGNAMLTVEIANVKVAVPIEVMPRRSRRVIPPRVRPVPPPPPEPEPEPKPEPGTTGETP